MTNTYTHVTMTLIKTENISKIVENPLYSFIVNNYPSPIKINTILTQGFPSGSEGKESTYNARNAGSILGSGRSP